MSSAHAGKAEKMQALLDAWTGHDTDALVSVWDAPESQEERSDGRTVWSYSHTRVFGYILGTGEPWGEEDLCVVDFWLDAEGVVTKATYDGEAGRCWKAFKKMKAPKD